MVRGFLVFLMLAAVACGGGGPTPSPQRTSLIVGLGYLQSVQFAQFYRAQQQGYYSAAGLDVTFQNEIAPNLVTLVAQGAVDVGIADGTDVIPAVGQRIPVRYGMTIYAQFPNVLMVTGPIEVPADLRGHSIGIPGRYGSSWVMLQAMLASGGLTPNDVTIRDFPDYGQATALQQGQVDAATGYRNNEQVQLSAADFPMNVLTVDDITPLPGPGLIVGEQTLSSKRGAIRAFVRATLRSMDEIAADPRLGMADAIAVVPDLGIDEASQLAILEATIEMWSSPYTAAHGQGAIDPNAWSASLDFMRGLPDTNIPHDLTADKLVTEELLP